MDYTGYLDFWFTDRLIVAKMVTSIPECLMWAMPKGMTYSQEIDTRSWAARAPAPVGLG